MLHNLNISRRPKFGKSVGFACHIRLDVKLCSNNKRNCVFRCAVSAAHFLTFKGIFNIKYFLNHLNDLRFDNYFCNNEQTDLEILVRNS